MKTTMKLMLVLALFCTMTFADDGNQGSGGRTCGGEGQPPCEPPCTVNCGGGIAAPTDPDMDAIDIIEALAAIISGMPRL
jgi:hypothetical protein